MKEANFMIVLSSSKWGRSLGKLDLLPRHYMPLACKFPRCPKTIPPSHMLSIRYRYTTLRENKRVQLGALPVSVCPYQLQTRHPQLQIAITVMAEDLTEGEPPTIDPYEVLGLERNSTSEQIKSAYRKVALRTHPGKSD